MPGVNPEILVWARETAGLTQEVAATKLGFRDSSVTSAKEKLAAIEYGHREPTRPQLLKMVGQYHRPLLTFYLPKPPKQVDIGVDFRSMTRDHGPREEGILDALVRDVRARQSMVRDVLEDEEEDDEIPFIGSHHIADGKQAVLSSLNARLGLDLASYRAQQDSSAAFQYLRNRTEATGIFVLLKGDLGNYKSAIETTVFRGFCIADNVAPFIVINDQDARSAWSFTLLHEAVHLLLGQSGISGEAGDSEVERFCDDIASECLLPTRNIVELEIDEGSAIEEMSGKISTLARNFKVSRTMVAYKAFRSHLIGQKSYRQLSAIFRREWRVERERSRAKAREQEGGPNYYIVRHHRLGGRIVNFVGSMLAAQALSTSRASRILGVSPRQVRPLLEAAPRSR